jgi:hypothetical protein
MPDKKELDAVIGLDANKRYEYSIKRIADFETLWVLGDNQGLRTYEDETGHAIFPIWPFKEFALLCSTGEFADCQPEELQLNEFMEDYIPDFKERGYKLSILPLPSDKGAVVEIDIFKEVLQKELDKY